MRSRKVIRFESLSKEELLDKVKKVEVGADEILESLRNLEEDMRIIPIQKEGVVVGIDVNELIEPLGRAGKVFLRNNATNMLANMLMSYWKYTTDGESRFVADVVETEDGHYTLRSKLLGRNDDFVSIKSMLESARSILDRSPIDRVVLAGNGADIAEIQFLVSQRRTEVKPGDLIDPGIFVSLNGGVKVAAGVHRLVCTNGLTRMFYFWKNNDYDFLGSNEMLEEAGKLLEWLRHKIDMKVASVREIAVVFGTRYPKWVLNSYWKEWAEKIELGELDWYDVINDITSLANRRVDGLRYRLLEVGGYMMGIEEEEHRCPVCCAKVKVER